MYFKNCFNPKKETLEIPRSSLHRANLLDAEELLLHTGGGYIKTFDRLLSMDDL